MCAEETLYFGEDFFWIDTSANPGPVVAKMGSKPTKPLWEWTPKEVGREGERIVAVYLEDRGCEVIYHNWTCPCGEADLVCREDGTHALVEVKTRLALPDDDVFPEIAVDARKRATYRRIAEVYLASHPEVEAIRFDVAAVKIGGPDFLGMRYVRNAFEWDV